MTEPVAYLNGQFLPAHQAALPIDDAGFVLGATVTEQLRTFHGQLFRTARHLERLRHSLEICGIEPPIDIAEFGRVAAELAARNYPLLDPGDDLGLVMFVTPGAYPALAGRETPPTVGLHTFPLAFNRWARACRDGASLVTTSIQQVPSQCWPAELKCRSRMHYYLADKEANVKEPGARALLLDAAGNVIETSTANIVIYRPETGLISPPRMTVLPGVSLEVVFELATKVGVSCVEREFGISDVVAANEVLLSSTPNCLLPVTRFDGHAVGGGKPGPFFTQLLAAWSEMVGIDIAEQAERYASR
jgi:branched-subunit amino acid aminotransferase/4-amino-4-deoxychorismate lyase